MNKLIICFILLSYTMNLYAFDVRVGGGANTKGSISQTTPLSFGTVSVGDNTGADITVDPSSSASSISCTGLDYWGGSLSSCKNWSVSGVVSRGVLSIAVPVGDYTVTGTAGTCSNSNITWRGLTAYTGEGTAISDGSFSSGYLWSSSNNPRILYIGGTVRLSYESGSDLGFGNYTCSYTITVNY